MYIKTNQKDFATSSTLDRPVTPTISKENFLAPPGAPRQGSVRQKWHRTLTTLKKRKSFLARVNKAPVKQPSIELVPPPLENHAFERNFDIFQLCFVCSKIVNQSGV